MARIRSVSGHHAAPVAPAGWEVASSEPGALAGPEALAGAALAWTRAEVPGTAASALRAAKQWSWDDKRRFDASDWWYRARFEGDSARGGERVALRFEGLATIAEAWLNGASILKSDSMFHAHEVDVTSAVAAQNELVIRFASLDAALKARRARPRWRVKMIENAQLRWWRTTLLGRMPGWTPPGAAVGPWRPVTLERRRGVTVPSADVRAEVEGTAGVLHVSLRVRSHGAAPTAATVACVAPGGGEASGALVCRAEGDGEHVVVEGALRISDVALWWPHTHGAQPMYAARVELRGAGAPIAVDLGPVAFRTIRARTADGGFGLAINGVDVFCRGASWMPLDVVSLAAPAAATEAALRGVRAAGMNMLRVAGVGVYEDEAFYEACDRLGILVWQDFMFANMDYPAEDPAFVASVEREVRELLSRTQTSPCLATFCGGSETEQQPAMLGMPKEQWASSLATSLLPGVIERARPDVPYVQSSTTGGTLPFEACTGVTHYFGVGGYMRPLEDARRAEVRFAAECLAFAHMPEDETIDLVLGDGEALPHHPRWKARAPRDMGTGWDHEDVRDHYVRELFAVDPMHLRYADPARYTALSRVVTGEVTAATFAEWRRARSPCGGALVFTYNDLWPGPGYGLVDSTGAPKAAYWYAKRALAPVALLATDEGMNGLALHAINERDTPLEAQLHLALYRDEARVAEGTRALPLPARANVALSAQSLLDRFVDITYAHRFGPPGHDVVVARLLGAGGAVLGRAFHFPLGLVRARAADVGLEARATRDGHTWVAAVKTRAFAQSVAVSAPGWLPDDSYFHLEPGGEHTVVFRPLGAATAPFRGSLQPLNAAATTRIAT